MNRSTNPLIQATVKATIGAIRKSLSNQPGIRIQPIAGTGKGIVPVRNGIGQRRKSVYGKRRHGISNTPSVRISCSPDNNGKVTLPVVTVQQAKNDDQLMQKIERLVEIQITRAFQTYKDQLLDSVRQQSKPLTPEAIQESQPLSPDYLKQISLAQEFLNENRSADLSRVKCLLRKMFPREYHDIIESLKEHQDPTIIYNISGGNNIIAPKAKTAKQLQENQDRTVNDER